MGKKIREALFHGFAGCSNDDCVIKGKAIGMKTNGWCTCLHKLTDIQLSILQGRLTKIGELEAPEPPKG